MKFLSSLFFLKCHLGSNTSRFDYILLDTERYLAINPTKSALMFHVISERFERASVTISINLEFYWWIELFENDMMVGALIDRITYQSYVLDMNILDESRFSLDLERKGRS